MNPWSVKGLKGTVVNTWSVKGLKCTVVNPWSVKGLKDTVVIPCEITFTVPLNLVFEWKLIWPKAVLENLTFIYRYFDNKKYILLQIWRTSEIF